MRSSFLSPLLALLMLLGAIAPGECAAKRKNVLFLVADDMRPEIGAYDGPDFPTPIHPKMHTPNLDALAKKSLLLKRAYVQQALCSPSRTSTLTGRRPDTTRTYDLFHYFRKVAGNFTTIPQYFKNHGYTTAGMGKIFHPGAASGGNDPISWTEPYFNGLNNWTEAYRKAINPIDDDLLVNNPLQDQLIAQHAVETLKRLAPAAKSGEKPFFVAAGFHRPHLPWVVPKSFLKYYPIEDIRLPPNNFLPSFFPEIAWSTFSDLKGYDDMWELSNNGDLFNQSYPDEKVKALRQSYYAAVSFTDSLLGQVMDTLDQLGLAEDTVISFFGDHGYHLGEHAEWCKHNNFDLSVHAPMMIHVPGKTDKGIATHQLTEFVDLYPTLAEAADLPPIPLCPENPFDVEVCTEGVSLMPLIDDPDQPWKEAAFSQYPRMDIGVDVVMGYTMRTDKHRYTEWIVFDYPAWTPHFNSHYPFRDTIELYDHTVDPGETINFANHPDYRKLKEELGKKLRAGWRAALPPGERGQTEAQGGTEEGGVHEPREVEEVEEVVEEGEDVVEVERIMKYKPRGENVVLDIL